MLQLRVILDGTIDFVDLYGDEGINFNYSFAEIQDITKKNSNFSQSFSVPGSKKNNQIFNHFYDLNSVNLDYDVRRAIDATLVFQGQEIFKGYIRLNSVTTQKRKIVYNITFYANVGKAITNIGDKFLFDLDYSDLGHPYNEEVILESLYDTDFSGGTEPYNDGRVYFLLAQYGYEYDEDGNVQTSSTPIIDYRNGIEPGYFDSISTPLRYYYLKPAIQIKWMYEQIFYQAGFNINSDFFNTAYFERFFLPLTFNKDSLYLSQAIKPCFAFDNDNQISGTQITLSAITWQGAPFTGVSQNLYRVQQLPETCNNINAHQFSNYSFRVPTDGFYNIKFTAKGYNSELVKDSVFLDAEFRVNFNEIVTGPNGLSGSTLFAFPSINTYRGVPAGYTFQVGKVFTVYLSSLYDYSWDLEIDHGIGVAIFTQFGMEILDGPRFIIGDVDYKQEFPPNEIKQIDFISSINKAFNLIVVEDKTKENTFRVEPLIDFIGKGETLDWTYKVDRDSNIQLEPTTNIFNGTLNYQNSLDRDYGNNEFNKRSNKIFGTRQINLDQDFKNNDIIFNFITGNRIDITLNNLSVPNVTVPVYFVTIENDNEGVVELSFNARKTLPNLSFRGLNLPAKNVGFINASGTTTVNNFYLEQNLVNMFPISNRYTTYPFGITGFTHAINFDKRDRFDLVEYDFSQSEDFYDIYYNEYKEDLTNEENRVYRAVVYLTPQEIQNLVGNEKILIDNTPFRINKITNYSLLKPSKANVELIKLTVDYTPHRKKCYTLTACDDPADIIYTNTDLNYTIWAYVGKKVKIGEFCYEIEEITCDDSYPYERIEVPFQNNSFIPLFYDDCDCLIPIDDVDITNDFVTPPVPTPTPSSGSTFYYYIIESCEIAEQALIRSTILLQIGSGIFYRGECWFVFAQTSLVNTNDYTGPYFDDCVDCINNPPTPTPTASITPTPTPTPLGCPCIEYLVENEEAFSTNVDYTDCYGIPQTTTLLPGFSINICACEATVSSEWGTITELGPDACQPVPTQTLTPSVTSTPNPTPTPTSTSGLPTPTPSVTPSCGFKLWVIDVCNFTCVGGICACEDSTTEIVYTKCNVTDLTDPFTEIYDTPNLISPWLGDFELNGSIWNSTGAGVSFVCSIGGPC